MKIIESLTTETNSNPKERIAIISDDISNEDMEVIQRLDIHTIDASDATDCTQQGFKSIKNAQHIICPTDLKELGKFYMSFCPNLRKVTIQKNTSEIGERSFSYSENLRYIEVNKENPYLSSIDGVLFSKDGKTLLRCPEGVLNTYYIPNGVERIAERAFYGCNGIKRVVLPSSIKEIGACAFQQCEGLRSINIPNGVHTIKKNTFFGCALLTDVSFPNDLHCIESNAFYGCSDIKSINLPKTIASLQKNCFEECPKLSNITIEEGGELRNEGKAIVCKSNNEVKLFPNNEKTCTLNEGTISIGTSAFEQTDIQDITFPSSLRRIGQRAFRACYNLTDIVLPPNIDYLEDRAFDSCVNLSSITCFRSTPPLVDDSAFNFLPVEECHVFVPKDSVELYKENNVWGIFKHINPIA